MQATMVVKVVSQVTIGSLFEHHSFNYRFPLSKILARVRKGLIGRKLFVAMVVKVVSQATIRNTPESLRHWFKLAQSWCMSFPTN